MIYTGENKAVLCKGDFHPAQLYKGDKKIAGYAEKDFEGINEITLENCYNDRAYDVQIEGVTDAVITARGKNYFDIDKVPFSNFTTQPYNRGLKAMKTSSNNRGNKIPISLPIGKTIYMTLDVVDSKIDGTSKHISLSFLNSSNSSIFTKRITSTIARKSFSFTLSEEMSYMQFFFQGVDVGNAVGDFMIMDNIMIRCEGDDAYEPYIEPQTILFENGKLTEEIPTFKGTTVIELESDKEATISGKYKEKE